MMPLVSAWRRPASREALILLLAVAAFVMAVAPALRETGTPPGWDQSVHLRDSLVYERILRHPSVLAGGVLGAILHGSEEFPLLTPSGYYPPLVPGITALLYTVAGRSYETAMATQMLFLVLLVYGTWALGNRLLGAPVGLVAGLMLMAAPGIRLNAEEYMLDLPLAAMVVVAVWALLSTDGFVRRDRSLVFGVLVGLGMLTKWTFFLFLALPVVLVLASGLAASSKELLTRSRRWGNAALALLAGGLVAAQQDHRPCRRRGRWIRLSSHSRGRPVPPRGAAANPLRMASDDHHGGRNPGLPVARPGNALGPGTPSDLGRESLRNIYIRRGQQTVPVSPPLDTDPASDDGGRSCRSVASRRGGPGAAGDGDAGPSARHRAGRQLADGGPR